MPKNIVICCDGTGNEFGDHNSNVVKLYGALLIDGIQQVAYYHPGATFCTGKGRACHGSERTAAAVETAGGNTCGPPFSIA